MAGSGRARGDRGRGPARALAYPALTGCPQAGDRVLLNTTALDLGLGTGGYALVVAIPVRLPPDTVPGGHLVKARYTPLQATVPGADEQGSPHYEVLRDAHYIGGMPVVVADLHSALPAVLAGVFDRPNGPGREQGRQLIRRPWSTSCRTAARCPHGSPGPARRSRRRGG